ncbi:hypothetical protein COCON_G00127440 [Conger conger]|uniref:Large ribosomal subunit protein mL53 n=1 Tax=Conger conger TaxID=82655 RepID=A0A9Q1DD53_CONCO|nr:39S ribosomal protein L53, mitochondrial [Conger conger]KAJ8267572.1 hypothetical protein COCON_G00127440 [Conger conger]
MAAPKASRVVLKAVKKIVIQFCPFESNVRSTREFLTRVASEKSLSTNKNCELKTHVKHDRSEPTIDITFIDGDKLLMKGAHLTSAEMLLALQSRCRAKDPQTLQG